MSLDAANARRRGHQDNGSFFFLSHKWNCRPANIKDRMHVDSSFFCERDCCRRADAFCSAGDQTNLLFEIHDLSFVPLIIMESGRPRHTLMTIPDLQVNDACYIGNLTRSLK